MGLPSVNSNAELFSDSNARSIFLGENRISRIAKHHKQQILNKKVQRVNKDHQTGQGRFRGEVTDLEQVIQLAGQSPEFDLSSYGLPKEWEDSLDITSKMAMAAGIELLRNAGVPLVKTHRGTQNGNRLFEGWKLPEEWRADTGGIFASAFLGYVI